MMTESEAQQPTRQRVEYLGKYRGQVVDNQDPTKRGRLQVIVPQVLGTTQVWALPCVPYAGAAAGLYAMPDVGTGVWVEFEAGDASHPIWVGCFWNVGDIDQADADPDIKFFKTKKFTLRIDDQAGEVLIENAGGTKIQLTSSQLLNKSSTIRQEAAGGKVTELSAAAFLVNNGAMEVL